MNKLSPIIFEICTHKLIKILTPVHHQLLDDTVGSVRDAGAATLGTATKVVGEKFMTEYINDLDNIKKGKVCGCV